jgi:transketolase
MKIADISMRDAFFDALYDIARQDSRVMMLTGDFGAPSLDKFRDNLKSQYINAGVAEQNMVTIAAGLALSGKIVYIYSIAPFVTLRCFEQIKLDLCCMNLHVTAVGVGAGYSYSTSGPTHHATEDLAVMRVLPGMTILNPSDNVMVKAFAEISYREPGPKYIRLDREKFPLRYEGESDFSAGLAVLKKGKDVTIVASGMMVHQAFKVAEELEKHSIDTGIVDLYRPKPLNENLLVKAIGNNKPVVTLAEDLVTGGIGSVVAEVMADNGCTAPLKRLGTQDKYMFQYASRSCLHTHLGLDVSSVTENILHWLK